MLPPAAHEHQDDQVPPADGALIADRGSTAASEAQTANTASARPSAARSSLNPIEALVHASSGNTHVMPESASPLPLHLSPFSGGRSVVPAASLRPVAAALGSLMPGTQVSFVGVQEALEAIGDSSRGSAGSASLAATVLDHARAMINSHVDKVASARTASQDVAAAEGGTDLPPVLNTVIIMLENTLLLDPIAGAGAQPLPEMVGPSYESWSPSDLAVGHGREFAWRRPGAPRVSQYGGSAGLALLEQSRVSEWPASHVALWLRGTFAASGIDGARAGLVASAAAASGLNGKQLLSMRTADLG